MAARFWVGGAGTWDSSTTTNWSATTGGAGGQSVPGSADTVTFDGASGGGVVTVNFGGLITLQSLTCGAFTGTLDFSANNNSVTLTASAGFSGSGTGTRTINLGNGTWTLSAGNTGWTMTTTTGLTWNANSSTISVTGFAPPNTITFAGGGLTYSTVIFSGGSGIVARRLNFTGANTFATLTIGAGNLVQFPNSVTTTVTTFSLTGTPTLATGVWSAATGTAFTLSVASGTVTLNYVPFLRDMACTGGATFVANNSYDFGTNSGITINPPTIGGIISG